MDTFWSAGGMGWISVCFRARSDEIALWQSDLIVYTAGHCVPWLTDFMSLMVTYHHVKV
jgi:hypothetical protein